MIDISIEMNHAEVHGLLNTYHQGILRNYEVAKKVSNDTVPSEYFRTLARTMKQGHAFMQKIAKEICKDDCINANVVDSMVDMDGRFERMVKEVEGLAKLAEVRENLLLRSYVSKRDNSRMIEYYFSTPFKLAIAAWNLRYE